MFDRIGAVILLVSNMKKSIEFYNDVLRMELKQQTEDWVEFSKQGIVLALHPVKKRVKMTRNNSMLVGFNISALETLHGSRKEKVKFYKN